MGILVKMKQIFIFSFLFLCSILIVSSYSAGEELNLSIWDIVYSNITNITNVTYPCLLINQSVYLSGNIPIGSNNCTITYFDNITKQIIIDNNGNGGGGGGSSRSRTRVCTPYWKCTEWTNCQSNSRATRECNDLNECNATKPSEKRYCYYYVVKEEAEVIEQVEQIEQPVEEQKETEETKKSWLWLYILIGLGLIILLGVGVFLYWYYFYEKKKQSND